jgi:hypothetical protein
MRKPDQIFKFVNFMDHLIGGIRARTIAAIGTVSPGFLNLQYLYAPKLHCNLAGTPITIVGNCSNKLGEFTMVKFNMASIREFPYFKDKVKIDATFTQGDIIPTNWLVYTDWEKSKESIIGTLVPNFFIAYFGQDLPYDSIDNDDVMLGLALMGPGYKLWAETAKDAIKNFDDISTILTKINDDKQP